MLATAPTTQNETLHAFLERWDIAYQQQIEKILMFQPDVCSQWSLQQKQLFTTLLYHQRGHFGEVLWYLGNFAPNAKAKKLILSNFEDEFNGRGKSHEQLYLEFAKSFDVDLTNELINEEYYLPFLREYNHGHLRWLRRHDWSHNLAAFAALERLDNLDYANLRDIAINIGTHPRHLGFFDIHIQVTHYDEIENASFNEQWEIQSDIIVNVFKFIGEYQIAIWKKISHEVCNINI
jgi:hypothetical protein